MVSSACSKCCVCAGAAGSGCYVWFMAVAWPYGAFVPLRVSVLTKVLMMSHHMETPVDKGSCMLTVLCHSTAMLWMTDALVPLSACYCCCCRNFPLYSKCRHMPLLMTSSRGSNTPSMAVHDGSALPLQGPFLAMCCCAGTCGSEPT